MAEVTEAGRRQGERLKKLRERLNVSKGHLMDALNFTTTQTYDLYERGVSVIRLDRAPAWAEAFGLSADDFWASVMTDEDGYDPAWNFRAELEKARPNDAPYTDRAYREHHREPQDIQRAIVQTIRDLTAYESEIRRERPPEARYSRAVAEKRAHYAV